MRIVGIVRAGSFRQPRTGAANGDGPCSVSSDGRPRGTQLLSSRFLATARGARLDNPLAGFAPGQRSEPAFPLASPLPGHTTFSNASLRRNVRSHEHRVRSAEHARAATVREGVAGQCVPRGSPGRLHGHHLASACAPDHGRRSHRRRGRAPAAALGLPGPRGSGPGSAGSFRVRQRRSPPVPPRSSRRCRGAPRGPASRGSPRVLDCTAGDRREPPIRSIAGTERGPGAGRAGRTRPVVVGFRRSGRPSGAACRERARGNPRARRLVEWGEGGVPCAAHPEREQSPVW